jgi:hypothetical protein
MSEKNAYFPNYQNLNALHGSTFVIPISIGKIFNNEEDFTAVIKLMKQVPNSTSKVIIVDTLQRFTLAIEYLFKEENSQTLNQIIAEEDKLKRFKLLQKIAEVQKQAARENGKFWISKNKSISDQNDKENSIKALDLLELVDNKENSKYTNGSKQKNSFLIDGVDQIIYWDDFLNHSDFESCKNHIDSAYLNDKEFQTAVNKAAGKFISSYLNENMDNFDPTIAFELSLEYIKEECAIMMLWLARNLNKIIYPIKNSPAHLVMTDKISSLTQLFIKEKKLNCLDISSSEDIPAPEFIDIKIQSSPVKKIVKKNENDKPKLNTQTSGLERSRSQSSNRYMQFNNTANSITVEKSLFADMAASYLKEKILEGSNINFITDFFKQLPNYKDNTVDNIANTTNHAPSLH